MSDKGTLTITIVSPNGQTEIEVKDTTKFIEFKYKVASAFGIESNGLQIFVDAQHKKQLAGGDNDVMMEVRDNIKQNKVFIQNKNAKV